jgi:hypothetical protein
MNRESVSSKGLHNFHSMWISVKTARIFHLGCIQTKVYINLFLRYVQFKLNTAHMALCDMSLNWHSRHFHNPSKWPTWRRILFSYMFITILYMFRAASCSSSGESIASIQLLVYVTLCRWPSSMQVGMQVLPDLHTRQSPTQSDIYQKLYWYNWFSWW